MSWRTPYEYTPSPSGDYMLLQSAWVDVTTGRISDFSISQGNDRLVTKYLKNDLTSIHYSASPPEPVYPYRFLTADAYDLLIAPGNFSLIDSFAYFDGWEIILEGTRKHYVDANSQYLIWNEPYQYWSILYRAWTGDYSWFYSVGGVGGETPDLGEYVSVLSFESMVELI